MQFLYLVSCQSFCSIPGFCRGSRDGRCCRQSPWCRAWASSGRPPGHGSTQATCSMSDKMCNIGLWTILIVQCQSWNQTISAISVFEPYYMFWVGLVILDCMFWVSLIILDCMVSIILEIRCSISVLSPGYIFIIQCRWSSRQNVPVICSAFESEKMSVY